MNKKEGMEAVTTIRTLPLAKKIQDNCGSLSDKVDLTKKQGRGLKEHEAKAVLKLKKAMYVNHHYFRFSIS